MDAKRLAEAASAHRSPRPAPIPYIYYARQGLFLMRECTTTTLHGTKIDLYVRLRERLSVDT